MHTENAPSLSLKESAHIHAPDTECAECARALDMVSSRVAGSLLFSVASEEWLKAHSLYIRPSTHDTYKQCLISLKEFFGPFPLNKIHIGHIRSYQVERRQRACARRVNQEMASCFIPVMREANLWKDLADLYKPLPFVDHRSRRNLSEEEERRLISCALDPAHPRRIVAGHCLITMCNTGMGFGELRHLRRKDVVFDVPHPFARTNEDYVKNAFRVRTIPLNWLALRSMRWIVKRWERLGGKGAEEFILPHYSSREPGEASNTHNLNRRPDFTRPMHSIQRAARKILTEAGLDEFVTYDMRSTFGTKLLSDANVSDQMFKEIFGHAPRSREQDRYSNQRLEKKAVAIEKLALEAEPKVRLIAFPGGKR